MNITFLVNIEPQLYLNIKYNGTANVVAPVRVYGAKIDDVLVADPVVGYDRVVKNKSRKISIAWFVVCLGFFSAAISGFFVWKRFFRY